MKGELFFVHHDKHGTTQRLWFNYMGAFCRWLKEGKRRIAIEADGDVLMIRDL